MNNAQREQRLKEMMKLNRMKEEQLIRASKKRMEEIKRNTQKKQIEILRNAQRRKEEIMKRNIREEEKMRENLIRQRGNSNVNHLIEREYNQIYNNININREQRRSVDPQIRRRQNNTQRILANIIRAENLGRHNNVGNALNIYRQSDENIINNYVNNLIRNLNSNNNQSNNINNIRNNDDINNEINNDNPMVRKNNENKRNKIIELLEEIVLTEQILSKLDNKQCLICLDNYIKGEKISYLPCFHFFHSLCIKSWIKRSDKCPLCKNIIKFE